MDIIKEEAVNAGVEKVVKEEDEELTSVVEEELTQRFLKVDVKHITEGQASFIYLFFLSRHINERQFREGVE